MRFRIASLDIARGAVMVLMAVDHVRVFAGVPTGGSPGVFLTRWITHFCAPSFIFLAGTAAFLYGQKVGSKSALAKFLLIRGLWLVLLELTLLRFGWTFNFDYANFTFAGVIWAIGWCMVVLAALVFLPTKAVAAIGLAIVFGHNAFGPILAGGENPSPLIRVLYAGGSFPVGPFNVAVLYVLIPWIGVMATGYGFGTVMLMSPERRRKICLTLGAAAIAGFIVLRAVGVYGDPRPWSSEQGITGFLSPAKYPASLIFLMMTLGPLLIAIALLENAKNWITERLRVFGQVPFFFYVLHIPLIHGLALLVSWSRQGSVSPWLFANHPMGNPPAPEGYTWSLGLLYLVWAVAIVILYLACRWFADLKARRTDAWLSYL